ncbi:class I SAM-dependent methyltransferase [Oceanobacillus piezotolerans]|uniref:Class I SAM-dependent methyltransferase n=1 Tax=Oceanobacillus piezotolerans TaxID=2448030 RepID=A0A498D7L6_9BACI|nr:class I SAM-dependent methyltransferase [Oceanobacillus piezotolerans]RLL45446.1 class I SAM-dependent methyltransferase [Oceanobacillus piezotolerans]
MKKEKLQKKYDKQARMYDNHRNEYLHKWRNKLLAKASGSVLEVGVGAGANFPFYQEATEHITAVDMSIEMIKRAKRRAAQYNLQTTFLQKDVDELHFKAESFDCIVSSLTVCAYPDPVSTLQRFSHWCKKDGRILLLEHGISPHAFLKMAQHAIDPLYKIISGCHCNRDILNLLKKANINVINVDRQWKGMLYVIEASPAQ